MRFDPSRPLFLVHGAAPSLRKRVIDEIVAAALPESEREWGLVHVDAGDAGVAGIVAQISGGSLMASERVVVVRDVDRLNNAAQKALAAELKRASDGTVLVLEVDPGPPTGYKSKGPPVAADLRKAVEERGQIIEAAAPSDRELPTWVAEEIRARGKQVSPRVAMVFVEIAGAGVESIINEIDKLVTYVGDEPQVTEDDVRQIVTGERENSIFDLVDAVGKRDARTALSVLPELLPASGRQGEAMPIIAMIARHFRLVWQARVLIDSGANISRAQASDWTDKFPVEHNFFDATKGRSFLVQKYADQARNFRDVELVKAFIKIHETDLALKGQTDERMDDRLALETLIISLCRL